MTADDSVIMLSFVVYILIMSLPVLLIASPIESNVSVLNVF